MKEVERTTNHDVKAVEYVLRETMQTHPELTKACSVRATKNYQSRGCAVGICCVLYSTIVSVALCW